MSVSPNDGLDNPSSLLLLTSCFQVSVPSMLKLMLYGLSPKYIALSLKVYGTLGQTWKTSLFALMTPQLLPP